MIRFYYLNRSIIIQNVTKIKDTIYFIFEEYDKSLNSLAIVFCDDLYLLEINLKYLGHNSFTDIITFSLGDTEKIVGEIYISSERIRENAKEFVVSYQLEMKRVIFHGCLHLCGNKDKTRTQKKLMTALEDKYLLKSIM